MASPICTFCSMMRFAEGSHFKSGPTPEFIVQRVSAKYSYNCFKMFLQ